jgi:polyadenylate-binding protein
MPMGAGGMPAVMNMGMGPLPA